MFTFIAIAVLAVAPPVNRVMPDYAYNLVENTGHVVVLTDNLTTQVATQIDGRWVSEDRPIRSMSFIDDGAVWNLSEENATALDLDTGVFYIVLPGENLMVIGGSAPQAGMGFGCICRCCTGNVEAGTASPCTTYQNGYPCVDPVTHQECQAGLTHCKKGMIKITAVIAVD